MLDSQTFVPAARVLGKLILIFVTRPVEPSNFHWPMSVGAAVPIKLKTDAPAVPAGFPRPPPFTSRSRICTVHPFKPRTLMTGAVTGAGVGVGCRRGGMPICTFIAVVTVE